VRTSLVSSTGGLPSDMKPSTASLAPPPTPIPKGPAAPPAAAGPSTVTDKPARRSFIDFTMSWAEKVMNRSAAAAEPAVVPPTVAAVVVQGAEAGRRPAPGRAGFQPKGFHVRVGGSSTIDFCGGDNARGDGLPSTAGSAIQGSNKGQPVKGGRKASE